MVIAAADGGNGHMDEAEGMRRGRGGERRRAMAHRGGLAAGGGRAGVRRVVAVARGDDFGAVAGARAGHTGSGGDRRLAHIADDSDGAVALSADRVRVVVDPKSLQYIDGTELDYTREGLNEGFKFRNPKVKDECGCGESFNV